MSIIQDIYEIFHQKLLECGATPHEALTVVEEARRLDIALNAEICPECEGHVTRILDPDGNGIKKVTVIPGQAFIIRTPTWFKYTCSTCNFFMSRVESKEKAS